MEQPSRKKSQDFSAGRARLAQFSGSLDTKPSATDNMEGQDLNNWPHSMILCGSNAFNQLSPTFGELMTPNFAHIFHPMFVGVELTQVCCGGNQTAVLVTSEESSVLQMSGKEEESKKSLQQQLYVWGSGRSATQMRVPIPLPPKCNIAQLSCGNTHMGFITERGQAFTWGSGDYGMLGHGTKSNVAEPRRVETFKQLVCTAISCGAFHTGFIACSKADMSYIRLPRKEHLGSSLGVGNAGAKIILSEECAAGGSLYMCGLGKAGQLGVNIEKIPMTGANAGFCARPTLVSYFEEEGARVIRVSCGFHHTLAIAVPKQALRIFSPSVFAFGFGEYGRLGLGHEDQVSLPTMLEFPGPFHATQVSAGEQHSVALGHDGCYAWGSNDMGQLGIGSPSQVEFASLPQKIALPEGMVARKLVAGGRHTAAVTHCGNVLSWGWGEEGQLGHGTEKSANLPRPCRLISVHGSAGVPMDVTLGGTHTAVVLHNPSYIPPTVREPTPEPETVAEPTPREPTPEPEPVPELPVEEPIVEASVLVQSIEAPLVTMLPPVEHKPPMISTGEDECAEEVAVVEEEEAPTPAPPPIRSLKDILNQREERRAAREAEIEPPKPVTPEPVVPVLPAPVPVIEPEPEPPVPEPLPEPVPEPEPVVLPKEAPAPVEGSSLFNNIAKRAEIRKSRKSSVTAFGTGAKKG